MQELRDNATEGVPKPDCEPEAARVSVDAVPAASKSESAKNNPPEEVKASKRRVGVHASVLAGVLAIGFCLGWKFPDVFDVSPDTQNARVDLANSPAGSEQETTSALLSEFAQSGFINVVGGCGFPASGEGVLHLLVEDAAAARQALSGTGLTVRDERDVVIVGPLPAQPGSVGSLLRRLAEQGANIDLLYLTEDGRLVLSGEDVPALASAARP